MRPCKELEEEAKKISDRYGISKRKASRLILEGYYNNKFRLKNEKEYDEFVFK